jgi:uracil-DNA glycosylase family 4
MTPDETKAARELLAFYLEAGVESLVDESPVNRLAARTLEATPLPPVPVEPVAEGRPALQLPERRALSQPPVARPQQPTLSAEAAVTSAREAARNARTLDELRTMLQSFNGCALKLMATRLVFADGNPEARLMLVGEAPGREEDIEGLPFVGRSGQLLDRMLRAIGLDRKQAYITNVIPWRPPGNRTPTPQETETCLPFIKRQIELVNPDVLVCLGGPSMQALLGVKDGIMKTRGRWFAYDTGTREIRAMPTLHPAYLLRQPLAKRQAWRDLLAIKKALAE